MFTIDSNTFQTQNPDRGTEQTGRIPPVADSDATQRVNVGTGTIYPPQRRTAQKPTGSRQPSNPGNRNKRKGNQKEMNDPWDNVIV